MQHDDEYESVLAADGKEVAMILMKLLLAVNPAIDGPACYDIVCLMLREGLSESNAVEWGMAINATMFQIKSKDKH